MTSNRETTFDATDIAVSTVFSLLLLAAISFICSMYLTGESNRSKFKYAFTKSMECRIKLTKTINTNTSPERVALIGTVANSFCGKIPNYKDFIHL